MLRHHFNFVPARRGFGWSINDEGQPRVWWRARLSDDHHLALADGSDAHERDADVEIAILEHVRDEETFASKRGVLIAPHDDHPSFTVYLAVSKNTFDRILQATQRQEPPTVVVGFGPKGFNQKLTDGPVLRDGTNPLHYRWTDDKEHAAIEECEFNFSKPPEQAEEPEIPEKTPTLLRVIGIVWNIFVNVLTIVIAMAVLVAANTRFETAVVSLLLLFYVYWRSSQVTLSQVLAKLELAAIARFFALRTLLGLPASEAERKYARHASEKLERPGYQFWMESISNSIIGLMVLYRLASLVLSSLGPP